MCARTCVCMNASGFVCVCVCVCVCMCVVSVHLSVCVQWGVDPGFTKGGHKYIVVNMIIVCIAHILAYKACQI